MSSKKPHAPIASTSALARHLGLSRWTISRVLNGHPEVKPETCRRVRAAMEELGFVPSPVGRALRGARTGMVGVCFQALGSPIVARKIASLQGILRSAGFRAIFEVTDGRPDLEIEVVRQFVAMKLDGLILVGGITDTNATAIRTLLAQHGVPAVLVDPLQHFELPTVELDRERGVQLAMSHLLDLGHKRFALLGIDEHVVYGRQRWQGLSRVVQERGLSWEKQFVMLSEETPPGLDFAYGRRLASRFLALESRPTAVLALNDQVAIGAMSRLQQAGLAVPADLSMVGFDNLDVSAHVNPRLTTIDQHVDKFMQSAVDALVAQTSGDSPADLVTTITPLLVPRESTGRAPRA